MSKLFISPTEQREYERRKVEWGESGPAHNIGYTVASSLRTTIVLNVRDNVPRNSMEQQKKRTFT